MNLRLLLACFFLLVTTTFSRAQNIEDAPLSDEAPTLSFTPTPRASNANSSANSSSNIEDAPLSDAAPALDNSATSSTRSAENAAEHSHEHADESHSHDGHAHGGLTPHQNDENNSGIVAHNPWNISASFSGVEHSFMCQALVSGVLCALLCSYLGLFVVLRRIVFVSVALAQMSSAGVAFGILSASFPFLATVGLHHGLPPAWGAAIFTLAGVVFFALRISPRRVPPDSTIGMAYCLAGALAILLIARSAEGEGDMLQLLQGNILTGTAAETIKIAVVFGVLSTVLWLCRKEFLMVSFDRDLATTQGFRTGLWDFLFYAILGIAIAFSVRAVGVLLTTALLIIPATSALLWSQNWRAVRVLAPLFGVFAVPIGLHFSLVLEDFPPSPLVVALLFLPLLLSLLYYRARSN